jgi:hypothetical protein
MLEIVKPPRARPTAILPALTTLQATTIGIPSLPLPALETKRFRQFNSLMVRDGKDGRRQRPSSLALSLSLAFSLTPDRVLISSTLSILLLCDPMLIAKLLMSALGPLIGEVILTPPSVLYCFALPALSLLALPLVPLLWYVRINIIDKP